VVDLVVQDLVGVRWTGRSRLIRADTLLRSGAADGGRARSYDYGVNVNSMPAAEVRVSSELVRRLLTDQHPDLAGLGIEVVANG
jgi:hypothetical protein